MNDQEPILFETLRLPNVAALCFVIREADFNLTPANIPAAGLAYGHADYKLSTTTNRSEWGTYVCGWPIEAPAGYSAWAFVPSLPTVPVVKPRNDEIWGPVLDHTYYCLRSATLPDVAETSVSVLGSGYASRHVIAVSEPREMSGEVIEVTVTTAAAATATQTDKLVDQETGALYTQTKVFTVATTNPTGAATGSNALFTEAVQQRHRLWVSTTRPASLVGIGYGSARVYDTQAALYWPAVMTDFQMITVLNQIDGADGSYFKRIPVWRMRDAFSDPVKCVVSEWWQQTAPSWGSGGLPTASVTMQPAACRITGNLMSLSIPECLHDAVVYDEQNALGTITQSSPWVSLSRKMLRFSWAATNEVDWPSTFTKVFSRPEKGGYLCRAEVYHRPTVSGGELTYSSSTNWSLSSHGYWYALR